MTLARGIVSTQFSREGEKAHGIPQAVIDGIGLLKIYLVTPGEASVVFPTSAQFLYFPGEAGESEKESRMIP